jgi:CheY-like chemotaxis protein
MLPAICGSPHPGTEGTKGAAGRPDNGVVINRRLRVVLAEASVVLRDGMVELLGARGCEVAATAGTAPELLAAVAEHRPDVAVVDVRMPPTHTDEGIRAAVEIRATTPGVGILVLSRQVLGDGHRGHHHRRGRPGGEGHRHSSQRPHGGRATPVNLVQVLSPGGSSRPHICRCLSHALILGGRSRLIDRARPRTRGTENRTAAAGAAESAGEPGNDEGPGR